MKKLEVLKNFCFFSKRKCIVFLFTFLFLFGEANFYASQAVTGGFCRALAPVAQFVEVPKSWADKKAAKKSRKETAKVVYATFSGRGLIRRPAFILKASVAPKFKKMIRSPLHSFVSAAAEPPNGNNDATQKPNYGDAKMLSVRFGQDLRALYPTLNAIWKSLDEPRTGSMLNNQFADMTNLDRASSSTPPPIFKFLPAQQAVETLSTMNEVERMKLEEDIGDFLKKYERNPNNPSTVSTLLRPEEVLTEADLKQFSRILNPDFNFDELSEEQLGNIARNFVKATQIDAKGKLPMDFLEKKAEAIFNEPNSTTEGVTNSLVQGTSRSEKENKIQEADIKDVLNRVYGLPFYASELEKAEFANKPSFVPEVAAQVVTAQFILNSIYEAKIKIAQQIESVNDFRVKTGSRINQTLDARDLSILTAVLKEKEGFIAAAGQGLDKQKIETATPEIVAQWLEQKTLSPVILDSLYIELNNDRESLDAQYRQTQTLINRLDYVFVSSQQISLGGLKMANDTLAHLRTFADWFKKNPSFKKSEIQSINYVLGLTAPIPLGSNTNQYGLLQQYAVHLGDALVSKWKTTASPNQKLLFENEIIRNSIREFYKQHCLNNYSYFLNVWPDQK